MLELIVALTISGLIAVSAVSATVALSGARKQVDRRTTRLAEARRALAAIVSDLRNVRRDPIENRPVVVGRSGGRGRNNDAIDLLVISDRAARPEEIESDQHEVSFFLMNRPGQALPTLMRRQDHGLDEHIDEGGIATVVAEGVVGLSFEYYGRGEWMREWPEYETRAPDAVRATVMVTAIEESAMPRGRPQVVTLSTVVPLRVSRPTEDAQQQPPQQSGRQPR